MLSKLTCVSQTDIFVIECRFFAPYAVFGDIFFGATSSCERRCRCHVPDGNGAGFVECIELMILRHCMSAASVRFSDGISYLLTATIRAARKGILICCGAHAIDSSGSGPYPPRYDRWKRIQPILCDGAWICAGGTGTPSIGNRSQGEDRRDDNCEGREDSGRQGIKILTDRSVGLCRLVARRLGPRTVNRRWTDDLFADPFVRNSTRECRWRLYCAKEPTAAGPSFALSAGLARLFPNGPRSARPPYWYGLPRPRISYPPAAPLHSRETKAETLGSQCGTRNLPEGVR